MFLKMYFYIRTQLGFFTKKTTISKSIIFCFAIYFSSSNAQSLDVLPLIAIAGIHTTSQGDATSPLLPILAYTLFSRGITQNSQAFQPPECLSCNKEEMHKMEANAVRFIAQQENRDYISDRESEESNSGISVLDSYCDICTPDELLADIRFLYSLILQAPGGSEDSQSESGNEAESVDDSQESTIQELCELAGPEFYQQYKKLQDQLRISPSAGWKLDREQIKSIISRRSKAFSEDRFSTPELKEVAQDAMTQLDQLLKNSPLAEYKDVASYHELYRQFELLSTENYPYQNTVRLLLLYSLMVELWIYDTFYKNLVKQLNNKSSSDIELEESKIEICEFIYIIKSKIETKEKYIMFTHIHFHYWFDAPRLMMSFPLKPESSLGFTMGTTPYDWHIKFKSLHDKSLIIGPTFVTVTTEKLSKPQVSSDYCVIRLSTSPLTYNNGQVQSLGIQTWSDCMYAEIVRDNLQMSTGDLPVEGDKETLLKKLYIFDQVLAQKVKIKMEVAGDSLNEVADLILFQLPKTSSYVHQLAPAITHNRGIYLCRIIQRYFNVKTRKK